MVDARKVSKVVDQLTRNHAVSSALRMEEGKEEQRIDQIRENRKTALFLAG